jgi:hypothetical protein
LDTINEEESNALESGIWKIRFNFRFGAYLKKLEVRAMYQQYLFAYITTLGGAYHLCNKPQTALMLAKKQELLGLQIGSSLIIVKAKLFQVGNLRALGEVHKSQACLHSCKAMIEELRTANPDAANTLNAFVANYEEWMTNNLEQRVEK